MPCAFRSVSSSSPKERDFRRGAHADRRGREPLPSRARREPVVHGRAPDAGRPDTAVRPLLLALRVRVHGQEHVGRAELAEKPQAGCCCTDRGGNATSLFPFQRWNSQIPHVSRVSQTEEWRSKARQFDSRCEDVVQMFNRLSNAPNRRVLYDLYNYVCDIKSGVGLARAYVKSLGEKIHGTIRLQENQCKSKMQMNKEH